MKKIQIAVILFITSIFFNCNDPDNPCYTDLSNKVSTLETIYNCTTTISTMQLITNDEYKIITNTADYDALVEGDCHPNIDFAQYNLIIGSIFNESEINFKKYTFIKSCEPNDYKLTVEYELLPTAADDIKQTYAILIPKEYQIDTLKVIYTVDA